MIAVTIKNFIKKRRILLLLIMVFLILWIIFLYFSLNAPGKGKSIDIQTLEEKISSLGELITIEYYYKNLLEYEDSMELKGLVLPFSTKSLLIIYEGYIKAGVDLTQPSIQVKEDRAISMKLKKASFTDNVIKEESVKVYNEKSGLFNPLKLEEVFSLLEIEKAKTLETLRQEGFLEQANSKAEMLLVSLLEEMGFESILIEFE